MKWDGLAKGVVELGRLLALVALGLYAVYGSIYLIQNFKHLVAIEKSAVQTLANEVKKWNL